MTPARTGKGRQWTELRVGCGHPYGIGFEDGFCHERCLVCGMILKRKKECKCPHLPVEEDKSKDETSSER